MKHECENKLHHIGNNENLSQCFINAKDYFNINRNAEINCVCSLYGTLKVNEKRDCDFRANNIIDCKAISTDNYNMAILMYK